MFFIIVGKQSWTLFCPIGKLYISSYILSPCVLVALQTSNVGLLALLEVLTLWFFPCIYVYSENFGEVI